MEDKNLTAGSLALPLYDISCLTMTTTFCFNDKLLYWLLDMKSQSV